MRTSHKLAVVASFVAALGASQIASAETTGQYIDDATITTKVKAALVGNPITKASEITVETNHGAVLLTGAVDTKSQESEAVRLTNEINGVTSVSDKLTIKGLPQ